MSSPVHSLQQRWKIIVLIGFVFALLAGGLSLLFPLEYRADAQVLITSKTRYGIDPYTVVKSAETVGQNLVEVMKTDDFLAKVRSQEGHNIDWTAFDNLNDRDKRKTWSKMVTASVVYGTGVLNVSGYGTSPSQAHELSSAAANAVATQGWDYVGGDVIMKVVNNPVVTRWPVRPNIPLNAAVGFIVGAIIMGLAVTKKI